MSIKRVTTFRYLIYLPAHACDKERKKKKKKRGGM